MMRCFTSREMNIEKPRQDQCVKSVGFLTLLLIAVAGQGFAQLTVTPITWDVVGLDHNRPLTSGPELFPVGAEVCSASATTNVTVDFVWPDGEGAGHDYINNRPGSLTSLTFASIGAGAVSYTHLTLPTS